MFALIGAVAVLLDLPFFYGLLNAPAPFYVFGPGFIFASVITIAVITLGPANPLGRRWRMRCILAGVLLSVGMPIALAAGAASMELVDSLTSGKDFHFGRIGLPFFIGEITACLVWSGAIFAWTVVLNRPRAVQVLRVAIAITLAMVLAANLVEVISQMVWQKSFFLPVVCSMEQIGSAIILSMGFDNNLKPAKRS